MLRMRLQPPCAYQGGKRRQAPEIVRHMGAHAARDVPFVELCCGGAAVSLELISRGKPPELVTLVDAGPWGLFWKAIGDGLYDCDRLRELVGQMPPAAEVPDWMRRQVKIEAPEDEVPYLFPLLQSASFGGKPVGWRNGKWRASSWALEGSAYNPATVLPLVLERVRRLVIRAKGLHVVYGDVASVRPPAGSTVYFDPPYRGTSGYAHRTDFLLAESLEVPCYVSERVPLNESARKITSRAASGLNARNRRDPSEYLSLFNAEWTTPEPVVERVEQTSLF